MRETILNSKHVHLAGTATIDVVADLLKGTDYNIYTNKESLLELQNRLPSQNVMEYKIPFSTDAKEKALVCIPVSDMDTAILSHSLFVENTKCWTYQKNWNKSKSILGKKLVNKPHVIVHCNNGVLHGIAKRT